MAQAERDIRARPGLLRCEAGRGGCDGCNLATFVVENANHEPKCACGVDVSYFLDVTVPNTVTPMGVYQRAEGRRPPSEGLPLTAGEDPFPTFRRLWRLFRRAGEGGS